MTKKAIIRILNDDDGELLITNDPEIIEFAKTLRGGKQPPPPPRP